MKTMKIVFLILLCSTIIYGCGKQDLTRSTAKEEIRSSDVILELEKKIYMQKGARVKGATQGLWNQRGERREVIAKIVNQLSADTMILTEKAGVVIEVTGISSSPQLEGLKEVQFSWSYTDLPSLVRRFALQGGEGSAVFRLFDDGWPLQNIDVKTINTPVVLSQREKEEELADVQIEADRRLREAEDLRIANEKRRQLMEISRTPTKTIRSYEFTLTDGYGFKKTSNKYELVLTDTYLEGTSHHITSR